MEFLGLKIDTRTMTLTTNEKMEKVILKCQTLLSHSQTTVSELTKLIGLQLKYLQQQQQIQLLNQACSYQAEIVLKKPELLWCVENIRLNNGKSLRQKEPNL